jgi:predicted nucleic-acid-binding protein
VLFSCEGEDFAHFQNLIHQTHIENNIFIAEKYMIAHEYVIAHEYFLIAQEQYKVLTFPNEKLKFRIDLGILISEELIRMCLN